MVRTIVALLFCFSLLSCTTSSSGGYGWTTSSFVQKGWLKVNRFEPGDNTAHKRIEYEVSAYSLVSSLVSERGLPDYYMASDLNEFYYGYLSDGYIYHFLKSWAKIRVERFHYSEMKDYMPPKVFADFRRPIEPRITANTVCMGVLFVMDRWKESDQVRLVLEDSESKAKKWLREHSGMWEYVLRKHMTRYSALSDEERYDYLLLECQKNTTNAFWTTMANVINKL